ncbi:MAG: Rrf2 family transcriptional regulator [Treponema sp.]|nr:Rrf2 family transcriptional regulator [Treponema sp.]
MIVSTKGRYALRVMVDIAEHSNEGRIPLKEIADRQGISQKYIESIMSLLSKHSLVDAVHGKGGGYKLNRAPKDYKISDILKVTEGTLAPVACLESGVAPCPKTSVCRTLPMWQKLDKLINDFFSSMTLADLCQTPLK